MTRIAKTLIIVLISLSTFFLFVRSTDEYFEISKNLDIFASLYREINTNYVDETKPGNIMKVGIDAMLRSLDPYTNYIPESQIEDYRFITTGQYGGIGALIQKREDNIVITETYDGFPAQKAGVLIGDRIVEVDGKNIKGKSTSEISEFLKGQPSSTVVIKLERGVNDNTELIEKKLTREEIQILNVPFYDEIEENIGYIKLSGFTQTAASEFYKAFKELKDKKEIKSLIIDLRGNGGGLLRESVTIVNYFVEKGTEVVRTKGKLKEWEQVYKALNTPVDKEIPIVVLVDENSASASEIVAGSFQDLDRAVIIGRRTFGKGLVQQTVDLSYNSKLKITVAKYYIPSGRCIQKLNYAARDSNQHAIEIPDSLIKEYKSLVNGRPLFDGKGILPDIEVEGFSISNITIGLLRNNYVFDFATDFRLKHEKIEDPNKYLTSEVTLNEFKSFIDNKEFQYSTDAERILKSLKETSEKEHYFESIQNEYEKLNNKLLEEKERDFERHKDEISQYLSEEIVLRYFHQRGELMYSLKNDDYLKEAISVLNDSEKYSSILRGENKAGK